MLTVVNEPSPRPVLARAGEDVTCIDPWCVRSSRGLGYIRRIKVMKLLREPSAPNSAAGRRCKK